MNDPKVGETWYHRETLTPVYVSDVNNRVWFDVDGIASSYAWLADFQRDYAVDEPLTLAVLERLGWEVRRSEATIGIPDGPLFLRFIDHGDKLTLSVASKCTLYNVQHYGRVPAPTTLRELLNVLRVFGVASPIPEPQEGA